MDGGARNIIRASFTEGPDGGGALDVYPDENVLAHGEGVFHLLLGDAVPVAIDLGTLKKLLTLSHVR